MNDTTAWYTSKTIWGAVVAMVGGFSGLLHINLDASMSSELVELLSGIGAIVGSAIAFYGRVVATKKIG